MGRWGEILQWNDEWILLWKEATKIVFFFILPKQEVFQKFYILRQLCISFWGTSMAGWSRDSGCDWGFPRRIEIHFFFFSFFFLPFSPGGFENPPHVTLTFIETGLSYHRTSAQVCDAPDGEGNLVTIHFLVAGQGKRRENLSSNTTHTLNIFAKKKKERKKKEERRKKDKSGIQKAKGETRAGEGRGRIAGWPPRISSRASHSGTSWRG